MSLDQVPARPHQRLGRLAAELVFVVFFPGISIYIYEKR